VVVSIDGLLIEEEKTNIFGVLVLGLSWVLVISELS
jgi:hypothetical protein